MKKIIAVCLTALVILDMSLPSIAAKKPPDIISEAAVVMDVRTGQVLFDKNMDEPLFPASITKILTCALALKKGDPTGKTVTMTDEAVWSVPRDTTHLALTTGEIIPINDLLHATMMQSANDAANGLAIYVSESLPAFAQYMTDSAREMGAKNSNFTNSNGLPDPNHITTAYDMAEITRKALEIDGFRQLFGEKEYTMPSTNKQPQSRHFVTKHLMLTPDGFFYPEATGGKLGWTEESKHTSVTLAKKDDLELICVTMKSDNADDKYIDTRGLFDYCFFNFNNVTFPSERFAQNPIPVFEGESQVGTVTVTPKPVTILKPSTIAKAEIKIDMELPIRYEGTENINPKVKFVLHDKVISEIPLEYKIDMLPKAAPAALSSAKRSAPKLKSLPWIILIVSTVFLIIALLFLIRTINIMRLNKRINEKRRKAAQNKTAQSTVTKQKNKGTK
ncbi:MAG: D-alanyl-D-alanine carboxypeptidase family protein [Oscillospiraceae bacterium]